MTNKNKDCGSCKHFQKWKHDKFGGGLCELKDARTTTDSGRNCLVFKRFKFDKNSFSIRANAGN